MEYRYTYQGQDYTIALDPAGDGYLATVGGHTVNVQVVWEACLGQLTLRLDDGPPRRARVATDGSSRWVAVGGAVFLLEAVTAMRGPARHRRGSGHDTLEAQMPGLVRRVLVAPGDHVEQGQPLLVIEAMKMEIKVTAPHAGVVQQVAAAEGQSVERGQVLVELEAE